MSLKMEKKAEHFVRLLAKKLCENDRSKDAEAQGNAELKRGFRRALDNLPKSPLKTELQKNAASYFRKLEVLTRSSSNFNDKESTRQKDEEPQSEAQKTKDEKKKKEKSKRKDATETPLSRKSSKKITLKSSKTKAVLISSSDELLMNGEEENGIAMETHPKMKTDAERSPGEGFTFNSYATDSTSDMIDALAKLPARKKMRLATHAYNSLCQGKSFSVFLQTLHPSGKDEPTMDDLTLLKQEILTGFGSSDAKVLTRCEVNCLSGIITVAEKALDIKDMARMVEVQGFILNFLLWVKTQHEALAQGQDKQSQSLSNFEDLAAAMLSVYVDLSIILSRHSDDKGAAAGRHTLSKILIFLGHTPVHQLNLLLQVTSPTAEDCQFMVPIYKHMLSKIPSEMTNESLIKYLYAVRFSHEILKNQEKELLDDIVSVAMTAEPSEEFLQWMFSNAPTIYRSLPEPVKNRQVPVVEHLIKQVTREYMDTLLDIASDVETESQSLSCETSQDEAPPESKEEPAGALFFTDTHRDEDLARQVDLDADSVDALHSHLDTLFDDFDKESSLDGDTDGSDVDVDNTRDGAQHKASLSQRNPSQGSSQSQGDDSDLELIDMDTSAGLDPRLSDDVSLEEQKYNSMMATKDKKTLPSQSSRKVPRRDSGSSHKSPGRNTEGKSSRGGGDSDVVLIVPELQGDSDKESFTTARDNLDTTKESIDEEITFKWRGSLSGGDNNKKHVDEGEDESEDADEEDIEDVERDDDDEGSLVEVDSGDEDSDALKSEPPSKEFSTKPSIPSPKKSQGGVKDITKKQEQSPEETPRSSQQMHLRSMDAGTAGQAQSSLLRFFSPIRHDTERQGKDFEKPVDKVDLADVEVIPDSCDSGQDEKDTRVTPRRMKRLKALQGDNINLEKTLPDKAVTQSAKEKRLRSPAREKKLRSNQEKKGGNKPFSSSSEGEVDPALFLSQVVLNKADVNQSKMNPSAIEDVVSEGIRRIRAECVTSPSDLKAQPTTRSSASKLSLSKRKALTITGGVKSKTATSDTPRQRFKPVGEASTPADKATGVSAEKQQGVSPLSPSKLKRVAAFGDTYRTLAGVSSDSQTDSGSVPASQSPTPPKRVRLRPKDLGEVFAADTLSQKRSGKKQMVDMQPVSESSQGSVESRQGSNTPTQRNLAKKSETPVMQSKRTSVKSSCPTCQEKLASPQKKSQTPVMQSKRTSVKSSCPTCQEKSASPQEKSASPQGKSASKLKKAQKIESTAPESRSDGAGAKKAAVKRRASLPASKMTKISTKVSRKSLGAKK